MNTQLINYLSNSEYLKQLQGIVLFLDLCSHDIRSLHFLQIGYFACVNDTHSLELLVLHLIGEILVSVHNSAALMVTMSLLAVKSIQSTVRMEKCLSWAPDAPLSLPSGTYTWIASVASWQAIQKARTLSQSRPWREVCASFSSRRAILLSSLILTMYTLSWCYCQSVSHSFLFYSPLSTYNDGCKVDYGLQGNSARSM